MQKSSKKAMLAAKEKEIKSSMSLLASDSIWNAGRQLPRECPPWILIGYLNTFFDEVYIFDEERTTIDCFN